MCVNRNKVHDPDKLMLTQIIAGECLDQLHKMMHAYRAEWGIPQYCDCELATGSKIPVNEKLRGLIKGSTIGAVMNGKVKREDNSAAEGQDEQSTKESNGSASSSKSAARQNGEDKNSNLNCLADAALMSDEKNNESNGSSASDSDEDGEGNYSTLRELLIRPAHKSNGSGGSRSNSPTTTTTTSASSTATTPSAATTSAKVGKKSKMDRLDELISTVIEDSVKKDSNSDSTADRCEKTRKELKHFVRRYKWTQKGRDPLPIRIMTVIESKALYPDVPHSWLCNGKLLRLHEPNHPNNYRIFQDQWKRGQPVIVSNVNKGLDLNLWHPDAFARDFGEEKNDLVNCISGNLVPNQPMRKFWEGFEHFSKRLKDDKGNPMLLKLKDWPPGDDFAELMPPRYDNLMKALPLAEYTHRTGRLNLAGRLPSCFVKPDLGPKMYNAYGSALHPTKGTTNLHLDISDAVNVMVYVGIPKDGDNDEHVKGKIPSVLLTMKFTCNTKIYFRFTCRSPESHRRGRL